MTVTVLWYLVELPVIVPGEPADSLVPTELVGKWLGLVAAVTALWGLALFVTDSGRSGMIWSLTASRTGGAGPHEGKMHGVGSQSRENQW
jgi:hypothetical protein